MSPQHLDAKKKVNKYMSKAEMMTSITYKALD
jgi:hypothetical protein